MRIRFSPGPGKEGVRSYQASLKYELNLQELSKIELHTLGRFLSHVIANICFQEKRQQFDGADYRTFITVVTMCQLLEFTARKVP
jgi:hypothetical protein